MRSQATVTSSEFEEALGNFAEEYADQNDRDHVDFKAATVGSGSRSATPAIPRT